LDWSRFFWFLLAHFKGPSPITAPMRFWSASFKSSGVDQVM
jgi:hypothetical protein